MKLVKAGLVAVLSLLVLSVCASAATAEPLSMTFNEARANVGIQLSDAALFEAPGKAPFQAQIDPGTGLITAGALQVPEFSTMITDPIETEVKVDFDIGVITGSFTQATGALELTGEAGGTLTADGKECIVSTTPTLLTLSTAGNSGGKSPRAGTPFAAGLSGAGAIAGQWTDMQATPVDTGPGGDTFVCEVVEEHIEGPGGIWLEQDDVTSPAAPQLSSTDPASPGVSGTPRVRGGAEAGSTVRLYANADCGGTPVATGNAAQLAFPGIAVEVASGATVSFSATATDAAGNSSACSAPISYTRVHEVSPPPPPTNSCIVPKLAGKTLPRAAAALRAAGCKLGTVHKPKRPKGKRQRRLVVKSASPRPGSSPADGKVNLRLGPNGLGRPRH